MRVFCFISIFILTFTNVIALNKEEAKELFIQANTAFDNENYSEAIELYLGLTTEYESVQVFHNLSLSYYYNGNIAKAILYMEKANRLAPLNRDINKNLKLLEENVDSEIAVMPDFFLKAWMNAVSKVLSSGTWLFFHLAILGLAIYLLYLYLIKGVDFNLHFYYIRGSIIGLFIISLMLAGLSYNRHVLDNDDRTAIIMSDDVPLRMGAEANSQEVMRVNQGVKVRIEDEIGNFYKVKLQDYTEAWLKKDFVEII